MRPNEQIFECRALRFTLYLQKVPRRSLVFESLRQYTWRTPIYA